MAMTPSEIATSYRQARNPKEQITVLAHLNATTVSNILSILASQGVDVQGISIQDQPPAKQQKPQTDWSVHNDYIIEQLSQGIRIVDIAKSLGLGQDIVNGYCQRLKSKHPELKNAIPKSKETTMTAKPQASAPTAAPPEVSSEQLSSLTAWELQVMANSLTQSIDRLKGEIILLQDDLQCAQQILTKLGEIAAKGESADD